MRLLSAFAISLELPRFYTSQGLGPLANTCHEVETHRFGRNRAFLRSWRAMTPGERGVFVKFTGGGVFSEIGISLCVPVGIIRPRSVEFRTKPAVPEPSSGTGRKVRGTLGKFVAMLFINAKGNITKENYSW